MRIKPPHRSRAPFRQPPSERHRAFQQYMEVLHCSLRMDDLAVVVSIRSPGQQK